MGKTADEEVLASYDVVILDPMFQGSISAIAESGATLCGYVSLGEIRMTDPYYAEVDPAALLQQNADWPGTRRVDVRHESWTTRHRQNHPIDRGQGIYRPVARHT